MSEPFRRVTRADVARRAGVSETIVSYVINNNRYVKEEKRQAVEKAIRELQYKPNNIARALRRKMSNQILFIADNISNEHFGQTVSEMDKYAYNRGFLVSLCANRNSKEFVSRIISYQVDGIVISSVSFPERYIAMLVQAQIPVVLMWTREYTGVPPQVAIIDSGLYEGACMVVNHLYSRGRRNNIYIDRISTHDHYGNMQDHRYRGFVEQMEKLGLPLTKQNIVTGCRTEQEVFNSVCALIEGGYPVDGIFGRNDNLACIAMMATQAAGKHIPEDISIVGFDDSTMSRRTVPMLTTMEIQRETIAEKAIGMLSEMIQGKHPENVMLKTRLIQRGSS